MRCSRVALLVVLVGACALGAVAQLPGLLSIPVAGGGSNSGGLGGGPNMGSIGGGYGNGNTGGMTENEKSRRRNFNSEFNDLSLIGFHAFSVAGSFNLNTTCPGQAGNTIPVGGTTPANCVACPCNLPVQLAATLCVDSRRVGDGARACTLTFVGAIGGVAVRGVSAEGTCQITITRHGEATIMSGLALNPSSAGGVAFPTSIVLRSALISESKFFVVSVGGFSFAGFGERSVRRFNPFFRMNNNNNRHGGAAGGLGGNDGMYSSGLGSGGLGSGGLGGHGEEQSRQEALDAFINRRFMRFRCPSVAGFLVPQDPRINDDECESSFGRFNRDDETFIGNGNNIDDFSGSQCETGESNTNGHGGLGGLGGMEGNNGNKRMNDEFSGGGW